MFRDVPGCSGMFRNVPECSMFLVLSTPEENSQYFIKNQNIETLHCTDLILAVSTGW